MNEKQANLARVMFKAAAAVAGVFAMIGSIGFLVLLGKMTKMLKMLLIGGSSTLDTMSAATVAKDFYPFHDLARFGGFAMFIIALIYVAIEFIGKASEKKYSLGMAACTLLGFVGCFLTSVSAFYRSIMSSVTSMTVSSMMYGGDSEAAARMLMNRMFAPMRVGGIFILVSAALVIVCVAAAFIKPMLARGYSAAPQYPGQQYANQQYPGQTYTNQAPVNGQFNAQNNDKNNFTPQ